MILYELMRDGKTTKRKWEGKNMLGRDSIPVWIGILLLSGMFLVGQQFVYVLIVRIILWVLAVLLAILAVMFARVIYTNDLRIAKSAVFEFEGERIFFAYNWTKDPVRRFFLRLASYFHPEV